MKKISFVICLMILSALSFGQAAGNWEMNQTKIGKGRSSYGGTTNNSNIDYDGYYNAPYQAQVTLPGYASTNQGDTTITLTAKVLMNVKADSYQAIFGISQVCDSIAIGHKLINKRIEIFVKSLEKMGIDKSAIYIDFVSQVPVFEYEVEKKLFSKSYNEIPKGFELKKNIHVNYTDPSIADQLLIEATKSEIYDIIKVDYVVADMEGVYDRLRDTAIFLLNKKVKDFKQLDVKFIPLYQTVSESIDCKYPIEQYQSYGTFNYASLSAVNKSDKYNSTANTQSSVYYNKVSYKPYDLVINPVLVAPSAQFSYFLTMKYVLKKQ